MMPLFFAGLICNMFRGIWLATITGFITRFGIFKGKRLKILLVLLLIAIIAFSGQETLKSTEVYKQRISNARTGYARIATVLSGLAMFRDHPLLGVGYENYGYLYDNPKYFRTFKGVPSLAQAHNAYVRLLVEGGFLGLTSFIFIFVTLFFRFFSGRNTAHYDFRRRIAAIGLAILVVPIVGSFFDNTALWSNVNIIFYTFTGALASQFQLRPDCKDSIPLSDDFYHKN